MTTHKALSLFVALIFMVPSVSIAARRKKIVKPTPTEVALPVPTSDLPLATYLPTVVETPPVTFELGISSWSPNGFDRSTRNQGRTEFESGSIPMVSLNRMAPIDDRLKGLYSRLGLSAASLERTLDLQRTGGNVSQTQKINLYSARLGLEYRTRRYSGDFVQPLVSLSALPTMGLGSSSAFEREVNTVGVPFELAAGVALAPRFLPSSSIGLKRSEIGVGAQYVFGPVGGSRMDGFGLQGSLRVDL